MKKAIKILVSVLLAAAILFSIAWYLFIYDPGFTRDFLLQQARNYEQRGRNAVAVWLYNLAYRQAQQDDSVAIELAEYYKSIGNYSKAEYTLTKAIEDGGTVELYIALCKTYVEQDKLRDAIMMLDHVSSPEIKAQLDALRPEAPAPSYPSGHYSQYIRVQFTAENAEIYVSTDSDYPSTAEDLYTQAYQLTQGVTTFQAVAVAENGLVSTMAEYTYTVDGVVEVVTFADYAFESAIRESLGVAEDAPIYSDTLWEITSFQIPSAAISCEDLHWLPNLTELTISDCAFSNMDIVSQLTGIHTLTITDSVLSTQDLLVFAQLPQLHTLTLSGCYLSSIDNLAGAAGLQYLDLSRNSIRDISAVSGLTGLTYLDLSENAVIRADSLSGLTALEHLDLSYNSLITTAPLASLVNLTYLDISANNLMQKDVEGIENLTGLTWFAASYNNLINVDFLENCTAIQTLIISHNTILNISVLSAHVHLEYLDFSYNEVDTLPKFSSECPLAIINGGYNILVSLDNLAVLQKLEYIYMDYNTGIKRIDNLVNCPSLIQVNVYGSAVKNVSKLTAKGILVNFTPV